MELTASAAFINNLFEGYDMLILKLLHSIACGFLTFLFKFITLVGEKGIVFFLAAIILMCFSRTRKIGVCLFGAVACGALITNVILKDMVARPRPFEAAAQFRQWWIDVGAPEEDGYSFPSGHVTAAAAGMLSLRLMQGKKWTCPAIIWVVLMMVARNYLMAHYPSDVLAALLIGIFSAFVAYIITRFIFEFLEDHCDKKWCAWMLDFNIPDFAGVPSKLGLISEDNEEVSRDEKADAAARRRSGNRNYSALFDEIDSDSKSKIAKGIAEKTANIGKRVSLSNAVSQKASASRNKSGSGYVGKHEKR